MYNLDFIAFPALPSWTHLYSMVLYFGNILLRYTSLAFFSINYEIISVNSFIFLQSTHSALRSFLFSLFLYQKYVPLATVSPFFTC